MFSPFRVLDAPDPKTAAAGCRSIAAINCGFTVDQEYFLVILSPIIKLSLTTFGKSNNIAETLVYYK
jgi:hypothetical protein